MKKSWNACVGALIGEIGQPGYPEALVAALGEIAGFDYSVMFAYSGDARPIDLFDNFPGNKRRVFVTIYQEGPYLLDPFFLACQQKVRPDLYRLRDFAPDRFYQSEYFRSYYVKTGLSEEIAYFVPVDGGATVVISLMRAEKTPVFSGREFAALRDAHPVVAASASRHWQGLYREFSPRANVRGTPNIKRNIEKAFRDFGRTGLTQREIEVVEYVLKGHSSDAIGKMLGISSGTVRIHRKNIYAKLGINSQGELFSQFLNALTSQ